MRLMRLLLAALLLLPACLPEPDSDPPPDPEPEVCDDITPTPPGYPDLFKGWAGSTWDQDTGIEGPALAVRLGPFLCAEEITHVVFHLRVDDYSEEGLALPGPVAVAVWSEDDVSPRLSPLLDPEPLKITLPTEATIRAFVAPHIAHVAVPVPAGTMVGPGHVYVAVLPSAGDAVAITTSPSPEPRAHRLLEDWITWEAVAGDLGIGLSPMPPGATVGCNDCAPAGACEYAYCVDGTCQHYNAPDGLKCPGGVCAAGSCQ